MAEIFKSYLDLEHFTLEFLTSRETVLAVSFRDPGSNTPETVSEYPEIMKQVRLEMAEYFAGARREFTFQMTPEGTGFQKKVWAELVKIPYGRTISYKELAHRLGDEKVIRAAASANGRNPIAIAIPCHRVIGNSGDLVGYAGGLPRKRFLLDHENSISNGVMTLF